MGHCIESGFAVIDDDGHIQLLEPAATTDVVQGLRLRVRRERRGEEMRTVEVALCSTPARPRVTRERRETTMSGHAHHQHPSATAPAASSRTRKVPAGVREEHVGDSAAPEHGTGHEHHGGHGGGHGDHAVMFRDRFWLSLLVSVPVVFHSHMIQEWFGYTAPSFAGSELTGPVLGTVISFDGGWRFFAGAVQEARAGQPGMMDARAVLSVIDVSHASYRKMMQNLAWAAGHNVFAIPLAAGIGVVLPPVVGALRMSASTVVVALNAQLLRRINLQGSTGAAA